MSYSKNPAANKYSHTPRRVHEKAIDRLELKIRRLKQDVRDLEEDLLRRIGVLEKRQDRHFPIEEEEDRRGVS